MDRRIERGPRGPMAMTLAWGAVAGLVAAILMGVVAMVAGATWSDGGFFTPMYVIASSLIETDAFRESQQAAQRGDAFTWETWPALLGMAIHLVNGMIFGAVFTLLIRPARLFGITAVTAGVVYGLVLMLATSFVVLPIVAPIGSPDPQVRNFPELAGWANWTLYHVVYGLTLGAIAAVATRRLAVGVERSRVHRRAA